MTEPHSSSFATLGEARIPVKYFKEGGPPYHAVVSDVQAVMDALEKDGALIRVQYGWGMGDGPYYYQIVTTEQ